MTNNQRRGCSEGGWFASGGIVHRYRAPLVVAAFALALSAAPFAAAFQQVPDAPSPETGTAQVVAQGVAEIGGDDLQWIVAQGIAPPPANATSTPSDLGFVLVESGVLLVEDRATGEQQRLAAGEAALTSAGSEHVRAALGAEEAAYREFSLVGAGSEPVSRAEVVFSSDPFAGLDARHDIDLLQDALAPGAQMDVPAGSLPSLIVVLDGAVDVATEAGDVVSLGAGEAVSLAGGLTILSGEAGAQVAAVYVGPAVPRLGQAQAAATPATQVRVIEPAPDETVTPVAASPTAASEQAVVAAEDTDGDGLTDAEEAELNTDPALGDTDEDGLTDGQEVLEVGTAPLAPDTDADGVLDGDEVAQGTDPLDSVAAAPAVDEAAPAEEAPAEAPAATAGDSDGDGLEDTIEFELGTDPADTDTDDDGATDGAEYYTLQSGTRNPDTDGDGVLDGTEAENGTDPNDPNSF